MSYVIVENNSNRIVEHNTKRYYATEPAAKAGVTRLAKAGLLVRDSITIWETSSMPTKTHFVKNLMTGALVEEDVNLPYSCSVASESYWSN